MGATKQDEMEKLHLGVSKRLIKEVKNKDGDPRYTGMAIKFLSDNKVTMVINTSNELGKLEKHLEKKKRRFGKDNITDIATKQAVAVGEG